MLGNCVAIGISSFLPSFPPAEGRVDQRSVVGVGRCRQYINANAVRTFTHLQRSPLDRTTPPVGGSSTLSMASHKEGLKQYFFLTYL